MADVWPFNMFIFDSLSHEMGTGVGSEVGEGVREPLGRSSRGVDGV